MSNKFFIVLCVVVLCINATIGGFAAQYVAEFWLSYFKGVPVHVPLNPCLIVGVFFGEFTIPAVAITWMLAPTM